MSLRKHATLILAALFMVAAVAAWADKDWTKKQNPDELMLEESFTLSSGARLVVDVSDVSIDLLHSEGNDASVKVYASARSEWRRCAEPEEP